MESTDLCIYPYSVLGCYFLRPQNTTKQIISNRKSKKHDGYYQLIDINKS